MMLRNGLAAVLVAAGLLFALSAEALEASWAMRASLHIRSSVLAHRPRPFPAGRHRVVMGFKVDKVGKISDVAIIEGSGKPIVDAAALAAVRDASPVPAPPSVLAAGVIAISLPIAFDNSPGTLKRKSVGRPERVITSICRGC
jgi:TonB family protein